MSNDTCEECGSEQLTNYDDRGERICEDCGLVKDTNLELSLIHISEPTRPY